MRLASARRRHCWSLKFLHGFGVHNQPGEWPGYSKARPNHPDFELTMGRYWSGNPNRRQAAADYPIGDSDSYVSAVLYNGVGGADFTTKASATG